MSTVFHVGDAVKVKRIIKFAPLVMVGTQGIVIGIYHKLSGHIDVCVSLPNVRKSYWWICTPEELELVQDRNK
jgi:hypothetical protein